MIVVSDTSPINYLVLVEAIFVLPALYGKVLIPQAVYEELQREQTPELVRNWIAALPDWLEVQTVVAEAIPSLDPGECEAIALALQQNADVLLIDERRGRAVAEKRGLKVAGILGILKDSANAGLLSLPDVLARLKQTNFRFNEKLLETLLNKQIPSEQER